MPCAVQMDNYNSSGNVKDEEWSYKKKMELVITPLLWSNCPPVGGSRHKEEAFTLRNVFVSYLNGQGDVPWQWDHVRRSYFISTCCGLKKKLK